MESTLETDCSALETLFQQIITDLKGSFPIWEEFMLKSTKLHAALRTALVASSAFLECFQKVADMANGTRGATCELGSALTRLCLRQRAIEDKFKKFSSSIIELLVVPLQDHMEEWKKSVIQLDKEHSKEMKKQHQDVKKAHTEMIRLKKKAKKGKTEHVKQLDVAVAEFNDRSASMEQLQRSSVRSALIEQRSRFCFFIGCLQPVMDWEVATLSDATHIQEILDSLRLNSADPYVVTLSTERVVMETKRGASTDLTIPVVVMAAASQKKCEMNTPCLRSNDSRKSSVSSTSSGGGAVVPSPSSSPAIVSAGVQSPTGSPFLCSGNGSKVGVDNYKQECVDKTGVGGGGSMKGSVSSEFDEEYERLTFHGQHSPTSPSHTPGVATSPSFTRSDSNQSATVIVSSPSMTSSQACHVGAPRGSSIATGPSPSGGTMTIPEHPVWSEQKRPDQPVESCYDLPPTNSPILLNPYSIPNLSSGDRVHVAGCPAMITDSSQASISGHEDSINTGVCLTLTNDKKPSGYDSKAGGQLEGYVNMNQLACLAAVQQQDSVIGSKAEKLDPASHTNPSPSHVVTSPQQGISSRKSLPNVDARVRFAPISPPSSCIADVLCIPTQRRDKQRDRSMPPLSRNSTKAGEQKKTSNLSSVGHSVTVTPVKGVIHYCAIHGAVRYGGATDATSNTRRGSEQSTTEFLPPPPPELRSPQPQVPVQSQEDIDDLPLPPPPEELNNGGLPYGVVEKGEAESRSRSTVVAERGTMATIGRSKSVVSPPSHTVSPVNKFCEKGSVSMIGQHGIFKNAADSNIVKTDAESESGTFSDVIHRGVQLRRTVTSDRSAPRLPRT